MEPSWRRLGKPLGLQDAFPHVNEGSKRVPPCKRSHMHPLNPRVSRATPPRTPPPCFARGSMSQSNLQARWKRAFRNPHPSRATPLCTPLLLLRRRGSMSHQRPPSTLEACFPESPPTRLNPTAVGPYHLGPKNHQNSIKRRSRGLQEQSRVVFFGSKSFQERSKSHSRGFQQASCS